MNFYEFYRTVDFLYICIVTFFLFFFFFVFLFGEGKLHLPRKWKMVVSCTRSVFKIRSVSRCSLFEDARLGWRPRDKQQQKSRRGVIVCFESFSAVPFLYYTKNIGEGRLKQVDKLEVYFTSGTILRIFRGMRMLSSRIPALISTRSARVSEARSAGGIYARSAGLKISAFQSG